VKATRREAVKTFVGLSAGAPFWALGSSALAQDGSRPLRVGILSSGDLESRSILDKAFVKGLREHGYVEGKNLIIERRYGLEKIQGNASELAAMKLDAILTTCTPSTRLMKATTTTTPIVMAAVSDPVQQGLIESLARPGQNVTGTSSQAEDLLAKRLELLRELLPGARTVAVLVNTRNPVHELGWNRIERAARETGIALVRIEISAPTEVSSALDAAMRSRPDALLVLPDDPLMLNVRAPLVEAAVGHRLPDFHWAREFVETGGLMSYGENLRNSYVSAAGYMDKIRKGALPANLPVEQPRRFELVINLKTAKALGITVPQPLLLRADELIP